MCAESLLITAGGQQLCCWDLVSGGRLLHKLTAHQKTITSVAVQHIDSGSSGAKELRVISASLDGHVKVRAKQLCLSNSLLCKHAILKHCP